MKNKLIIPIIILFLIALTPQFGAQFVNVSANTLPTNNYDSVITITGVGEVFATPDTAIISVGVETSGIDLTMVEKQTSDKVKALADTLKNHGIEDKDIKTTNYRFHKDYDYTNGQKFVGYTVTNQISFKTKNLKGLSTLITELTKSGANIMNGIQFTVEDTNTLYNQALSGALQNANSKMTGLLQTNASNYKLINIVEQDVYHYQPMIDSYAFLKTTSNLENTVFEGEFNIKATIKATYALANQNSQTV